MPGVSRVHEKNINDAGSRVELGDDFLAKLSQIRNSSLRERFWRTLESLPNLLDLIWALEVKTRLTNNYWDPFQLNRADNDRTQECAALLAFHVPRIMDLEVIGCAIAMPALRYAANIGLVKAVSLMKKFDRAGFALLDDVPQWPGEESPDYISVSVGDKWELYSKRDQGGYYYYDKLKFETASLKNLSMGHLQGIFKYKRVLPDGCIELFKNIDETCAVISRIVRASNAAKPRMARMGWRLIETSDLIVDGRVQVKPFKIAPTRRPWLDARRRPEGLLHEASNAGTGPRDWRAAPGARSASHGVLRRPHCDRRSIRNASRTPTLPVTTFRSPPQEENGLARGVARTTHSGGIVDLLLNDYLETLGTFLSEIKLSMGVRIKSGCDGCDDSDDDDEPLVDQASTTTGGFADALTEVGPYVPITSTSKKNSRCAIDCYFDLSGDIGMAPMCYTSAAIVTHFTAYDVYCVVPLTEASGVPQALLQNGRLYLVRVVQAFLDGETDLMKAWSADSPLPKKVQRIICDGLCLKKDLPNLLKPHLKHHYRVIREQCKAQFATDFIITSCTYDDPPAAFFGELLALTSRVMRNIDDQIAARDAVRKAHRDARDLRRAKHLALRNAMPTAAEWKRYWSMKHFGREVDGPCSGGLFYETKQCLCDHLGLDSTGRTEKLASRLHDYFQRVDLRIQFPTDGGERRPNWRSPACGLPPLKRARLAAEELSEEYYGHVCTVQKWTRRLVAQTDIVPARRREWGEDLKRKAREAAEDARVRRRAMLHHVVERDQTADAHVKSYRLRRARELIGQGHFYHDVRPPVRLELPPPRPVPGRLFTFDSDLP